MGEVEPLVEDGDQLGLRNLATRLGLPQDHGLGDPPEYDQPSSPLGGTPWDRRFLKFQNPLDTDSDGDSFDGGSLTRQSFHCHPDRWADVPLKSAKFIDDLNCRKKPDITDCASLVTTKKEVRLLHARKQTRSAAAAIGM